MTDEQDKSDRSSVAAEGYGKKRRDARYKVPDFYRQYIGMKIKTGGAFLPVNLFNFSRHGMMFESTLPLHAESLIECLISSPQFLTKDISFSFRVKYCLPKSGSYEIGAEIEAVADLTWFDIFTEVHDFIIARKGDIY